MDATDIRIARFADTRAADRTIQSYRYSVHGFSRFLELRVLTEATDDDIVAYQLRLGARGLSNSAVRVARYALRLLYREVLDHKD